MKMLFKKLSIFWRVLLFSALFSTYIAGAQTYDFKITTWNVEWLSCLTNGPTDREQQINNVVSVIKTMNSDLIALQEVGTSNFYTTIDTLVQRLGSEWTGNIVPWKVGNCNQNQGIIYKKSKINLVNSSLIVNGGTSYDWSSGRFPVLYNVNFVVEDKKIPISLINIHAKAYSDKTSYTRRKNASIALKNALDGSIYSTKKVVILGDFNDYLYGTTCTSCGGVSPYQNFMDDVIHYKGVTSDLTHHYYNNPVIDNIIISNELFDDYLSNSAFTEVSATQTIPNYNSTTSDHIPVSITFRIPCNINVTDIPMKSSFYVYPNPTKGEVQITSSELHITNIDVLDVFGKKFISHTINYLPYAIIDISHLAAGIYFIQINGEIKKVIKY